jgi:hypothetical protein
MAKEAKSLMLYRARHALDNLGLSTCLKSVKCNYINYQNIKLTKKYWQCDNQFERIISKDKFLGYKICNKK